jgi:hypothetical protein
MKMGLELLIPGMQYAEKPYFSPEFIFPKNDQCLGYGFKEEIEHDGFVFQDDWIKLMRQCKDAMKIRDREQLRFSGLQPPLPGDLLTFGAVPIPAGVI